MEQKRICSNEGIDKIDDNFPSVFSLILEFSIQCDVDQHDPHRSANSQRGGLVQVSHCSSSFVWSLYVFTACKVIRNATAEVTQSSIIMETNAQFIHLSNSKQLLQLLTYDTESTLFTLYKYFMQVWVIQNFLCYNWIRGCYIYRINKQILIRLLSISYTVKLNSTSEGKRRTGRLNRK